ncbi:MAG TPA: MFS transporter [Actinomycetota bacterium]|nr:MFS transporter [Actinomycetota bacterium]
MALTEDRTGQTVRVPEARTRGLDSPLLLLLAIAVVLVAFGWTFLRDPSISAPTRDPAWYTWRANLMMTDAPGLIAGDWGPFHMFGGGYRIAVPLYGSILVRVAGIDLYTFSAFMMIGVPVLTGMALGVFVTRERRDPLLFLLTMLATAALFMTTPYVGYLDNITVLFVLSLVLAFYVPAREHWGARVALFLLGIVAAYVHPTTCVIFGFSLMMVFVLHILTSRFRFGSALSRDGPSLMSIGFGMILGLATWLLSPWGVEGSLADAALPPPYTMEVFQKRLGGWVDSIQPMITVPLMLLAIVWAVHRSRKDRAPGDTAVTISTMWLIPLLGMLGWVAGAVYPYYRFMNATAAIMALLGIGAWVAIAWLLRRQGALRIVAWLGVVAIVASLGYVWVKGREAAQWADEDNQWIDQPTRTALAAARAIVDRAPDGTPVIFVVNFGDTYQSYGWSKTFTNVSRTGLPGDAVKRSMTYFGDVNDLLAGRPTQLTDDTYNKMARGFFREVQAIREEYTGPPVVFLVRQFNEGTANEDLLDAGREDLVPLGADIAVVTGPDLATPSPEAVASAQAAEEQVAAFYAGHPGPLDNLGHTLWVVVALALLLVVPGLLSARFFGIEGTWEKIALVPGMSIGLTVLSGVIVVAVTRAPFGVPHGWATLALATVIGGGLALGRSWILGTLGKVGGFFNSMFSVFHNANFAALMGVQFLAMAADGLIRGSIAKSIAFGGTEGFDVTTVPSADYLLKVVLALYIPYTFISPFIGVFIDRFERRRVLSVSNVATAVVVTVIAAAAMLPLGSDTSEGRVGFTVALIVGMLVMQACVRIVLAVKSAAMPDVLSGKDLLQGNGLSQAGGALFQVLGAGVAFGFGAFLPSWLVVIGGGAVLVVAAFVSRRIHRMESAPHEMSFGQEAKRIVRDIVAGLKEVANRPAGALGLTSFQMIRYQFWGFVLFVFALYAKNLVEGGEADTLALGLVGGLGFVGGALGMVLAQRWKDTVPPVRLLIGSMALLGAGTVVFGWFVSLAGFAGLLFVGFFSFFVAKISADTVMQQAMPDDFRGRAFALFDIAYNIGFIVPALLLSIVWIEDDPDRVRQILLVSGVVFLVLTALVARWARSIREQFAPQDDLVEIEP